MAQGDLQRAREESVRISTELADAGAALEAARGRAADLREKLRACENGLLASKAFDIVRDGPASAQTVALGRAAERYREELDAAETSTIPAFERRATALREAEAAASRHYDEQFWLSVPAACAHLFEAAEEARRQFELVLTWLDSVASEAHRRAHVQSNGAAPEATAAYRCYRRLEAMVGILTGQLGVGATRDFRTGPELLEAIANGEAKFGDVSRWEPGFRGVVDGTGYINREKPLQSLHTSETPPVASDAAQVVYAPSAGAGEAAGDRIVAMLEGQR